jgi:hypothetical protein
MAPVAGNSGENAGADRKKGANAWKSFRSFLRFKLGLVFQTSLSKKPTRSDLPTRTHTQWLTTRVLSEFICYRERLPRRSRPRRVGVHLLQPSLRGKTTKTAHFADFTEFLSQIEFGTLLGYPWMLLGTSGDRDFKSYTVGYPGSAEIAWGSPGSKMPHFEKYLSHAPLKSFPSIS